MRRSVPGKAGFDGVELNGGHGYLIAEFLSSYTNKRVDEYGGILSNRLRFVKEIIQDVRAKVGSEFPPPVQDFLARRDAGRQKAP